MTTDHDNEGKEEGAGTPVRDEDGRVEVIVSLVEGDERGFVGVDVSLSVAGTEVNDEPGVLSSLDQ